LNDLDNIVLDVGDATTQHYRVPTNHLSNCLNWESNKRRRDATQYSNVWHIKQCTVHNR